MVWRRGGQAATETGLSVGILTGAGALLRGNG